MYSLRSYSDNAQTQAYEYEEAASKQALENQTLIHTGRHTPTAGCFFPEHHMPRHTHTHTFLLACERTPHHHHHHTLSISSALYLLPPSPLPWSMWSLHLSVLARGQREECRSGSAHTNTHYSQHTQVLQCNITSTYLQLKMHSQPVTWVNPQKNYYWALFQNKIHVHVDKEHVSWRFALDSSAYALQFLWRTGHFLHHSCSGNHFTWYCFTTWCLVAIFYYIFVHENCAPSNLIWIWIGLQIRTTVWKYLASNYTCSCVDGTASWQSYCKTSSNFCLHVYGFSDDGLKGMNLKMQLNIVWILQ